MPYKRKGAIKKRPYKKRARAPKKASGLNKTEKQQVSKMIKGKRETWYLQTIKYCLGQGVQTSLDKHQLLPHSCFQSANRITMVGLLSADTFTNIGNDVNSNSVHTTGQRLFLTGGCRARDLNNVGDEDMLGNMGYMKSHLQKIKIHAKALCSLPSGNAGCDKLIPLNFRVLVVQVQPNRPVGSIPSFTNVGSTGSPSLFRDRFDVKVGIDDLINPYDLTNGLRVDTKAFKVVRDIKFKLSNPLGYRTDETGTSGNPISASNAYQYPATKELDLWLPQPKKPVKFDAGTQLPTNYDYRYYTFVFCSSDSTYNSQAMGTTEDRWVLESTSIARFQEY